MTERRCPECARGQHSRCDWWYGRLYAPCGCRRCEAWLDEHGLVSMPGEEPERAS